MSSGSDAGLYLSPLSDMSPAPSDCLGPYFSFFFLPIIAFVFFIDFSRSFYFSLIFHNMYPFWVVSVSRAILPLYSKPRGSRSRHFSLIHELFFTVENRSIFLSTIILNTKSYIVLLDTGLKSPECCIEL